ERAGISPMEIVNGYHQRLVLRQPKEGTGDSQDKTPSGLLSLFRRRHHQGAGLRDVRVTEVAECGKIGPYPGLHNRDQDLPGLLEYRLERSVRWGKILLAVAQIRGKTVLRAQC